MKTLFSALFLLPFFFACHSGKQVAEAEPANKAITQVPDVVKKSLADSLVSIIQNKGIEAGLQWYADNRTNEAYEIVEEEMTEAGYNLLDQGRISEAYEILRLNVEAFPDSKNVFGEYAICNVSEQLWRLGMEKEALQFLELNMKVNADSEMAHRYYGDFHSNKGEYDKAIGYYEKAASLSSENNLFNIIFKTDGTYNPTEIPADTTELFIAKGDMTNDTAYPCTRRATFESTDQQIWPVAPDAQP